MDSLRNRPEDSVPLFSVIVPSYGRPKYLSEALESVLSQTVSDFELVVVDDASPTAIAIPTHPKIRLFRNDVNGGPAAARNAGLRAARGQIITFLDDDDLYAPNRLALASEGLRRSDVTICWDAWDDGGVGKQRRLNGWVTSVIMDDINPHLGTVAVRREKVLPFDESYRSCEDVEWWLRVAQSEPVTTVESVGLIRRRHDEPRVGYGDAQRARDGVRLIEHHAEYFWVHRRASYFRWKRVGLATPDNKLALKALWNSFRAVPSAKGLGHMASRAVGLPIPRARDDRHSA